MKLSAIDVGEGPAAVLLHGQPGNSGDWWPVAVRLRERVRIIAPDRPGYGRTGGRAAGFRENAEALVALLDRLEIESAVVAGHSWASGVALAAAIQFPDRVRALVLVGPVAPGLPPSFWDRVLADPLIGAPVARLGFGLVGLGLGIGPVRRLARAAVPELPPAQVETTAAQWRGGGVWRSFFAEQRALLTELPSLAPDLASIDKPTTILCGTRDRITPPAHARALARTLPRAHLVSVDGAGHLLPQDHPGLVAEHIWGHCSQP